MSSEAVEQHDVVPLRTAKPSDSFTDSEVPCSEGVIVDGLANEKVRMS
jgi:hypothetical protein